MAGVSQHIRAALDSHLNTLSGIPSVAWPNADFKPTKGAAWLRPSLLPGRPRAMELGPDSLIHQIGVYQVSVFYPRGEYIQGAETLADSIASHFKRGTACTSGGVTVKVAYAFTAPAQYEFQHKADESGDWYHMPVLIEYFADTENS